jgi:hypothetical protein
MARLTAETSHQPLNQTSRFHATATRSRNMFHVKQGARRPLAPGSGSHGMRHACRGRAGSECRRAIRSPLSFCPSSPLARCSIRRSRHMPFIGLGRGPHMAHHRVHPLRPRWRSAPHPVHGAAAGYGPTPPPGGGASQAPPRRQRAPAPGRAPRLPARDGPAHKRPPARPSPPPRPRREAPRRGGAAEAAGAEAAEAHLSRRERSIRRGSGDRVRGKPYPERALPSSGRSAATFSPWEKECMRRA